MSRTPIAVCLALVVGLCEVGTGRPQAAPQADSQTASQADSQGAGAQEAAAPEGGAPEGDDTSQATFRAGINFVRVDVIVSDDDGQPVTDLTADDFEVFEDGERQDIEQFRLIRVDGTLEPGAPRPRQLRTSIDTEIELARDDVRLFMFFFDDYHVRLSNSRSVQAPLIRFLESLGPNDVVGMMYPLTPLDAISFTRNHASIISAIERFEGRKFDYRPRNTAEERYAHAPSEIVEQIRNQVVMGALRSLSTHLGGLREGRKSIIYISEGLTAILPPQLRNADASMPGMGNPNARNPMAGENNPREQTAAVFGAADLYSQLRDVFAAANRNNAAIYSLDPRGLSAFEFDIDQGVGMRQDARALQMTQDTLRTLASETDGRAIMNQNDLAPGLAQIMRDSSFYYLLGYNSTQAPTDGEFHSIDVRLKRRGLDVRARKGYWALTEADIVRATTEVPETPKPIQQALASIATSVQAGKYVRTWLGTARGESGKTEVTLIWEPLPPRLGAGGNQPDAGSVSLIAATMDGDLVFRGQTTGAGASGPTPAPDAQRLVFEASPGELELRMTVEEGAGGGMLDREIRTFTVPDLTSPDAAISTPRVYRGRTALDFRAIAANADAVPTVAREFSRTERLLIRFDVYGNATATAALLNRNGEKRADLPVTATAAGGTHQIDVGLGSIAPGEYLIEVTATGATGETKELVPLRVGA
ncbi:MAG: VWA domain-containing protein [Acidobacteria bacterium]|nr:VWA domain-containing protein [Acidobacteriota bacterium]